MHIHVQDPDRARTDALREQLIFCTADSKAILPTHPTLPPGFLQSTVTSEHILSYYLKRELHPEIPSQSLSLLTLGQVSNHRI